MSEWSAGYVTEIGYTYGYYVELNPLRARFALHSAGIVAPTIRTACELGFGQGVSVNAHAAASPVRWYATDFNPAQALFAQQLANASESGAVLADQAFAEFCARPDLPDFDYIGLHGIWTWISDENRAVIVDFIRRKLKVGGVLYISYNALPGWSGAAPLRHLLTQHGALMSASGQGIVPRINSALEFAEKLMETKPIYARAVPGVPDRLKKLKDQNRHYLAHEYFNRDWKPMYFADIANWLEPAKVSYATSAHYADLVPAVNLTSEQQTLLAEITDPGFRETIRDYITNTQFRRDYWVKGERRLTAVEQMELLRKQRVVLITARSAVNLKVMGSLGEVTMNAEIHDNILDALADHQPRSLGELERVLMEKGQRFPQMLRALLLLISKNDVALVQDEEDVALAKPQSDKLNAKLLERVRSSSDLNVLISPLIGAAVSAPHLTQLMLLAHRHGVSGKDQLAELVWQLLQALGRKVAKDGKNLATPEENLAELRNIAEEFLGKTLPMFQALKIV